MAGVLAGGVGYVCAHLYRGAIFMLTTRDEFNRNGYALLKSVIEPQVASELYAYGSELAASGQLKTDALVPGAPAAYGNPRMDGLLEQMLPKVEEAAGRRLYATYSYFRFYRTGDKLPRHRDRFACEISVSLCLGYRAEKPWPLFIKGPSGVFAAELEPGDGIIYKGVECPHWREPFTGESNGQLFLHYVDQDGPFAKLKLDRRVDLGQAVSQTAPA
jgi:hypothetical protein